MSVKKFLILTGLFILLSTVAKYVFILILNIDSLFVIYGLWLVLVIITIALTRRLGVIHYLEAIVVIVVWTIASLITDVMILTAFTGLGIYYHLYLWISYIVVALAIFIFHKKRHVEIRRAMK